MRVRSKGQLRLGKQSETATTGKVSRIGAEAFCLGRTQDRRKIAKRDKWRMRAERLGLGQKKCR